MTTHAYSFIYNNYDFMFHNVTISLKIIGHLLVLQWGKIRLPPQICRVKRQNHSMQMRNSFFSFSLKYKEKCTSLIRGACARERERRMVKDRKRKSLSRESNEIKSVRKEKYVFCSTDEALSSSAASYLQMTVIHNSMTVNKHMRALHYAHPDSLLPPTGEWQHKKYTPKT